jgi:hypothetical protein
VKRIYYAYPLLVVAVFVGIIQLSTLTPYWNTSSRTIGSFTLGTGSTDGASGVLRDTADVKGTWTLADTATTFQVPVAEIKAHFGIPADVPDGTAVKDVKKYAPDFEPELLREWLKERSPVAKK